MWKFNTENNIYIKRNSYFKQFEFEMIKMINVFAYNISKEFFY